MKKFVSILLSLLMMTALFTAATVADAAEYNVGDYVIYQYYVTSDTNVCAYQGSISYPSDCLTLEGSSEEEIDNNITVYDGTTGLLSAHNNSEKTSNQIIFVANDPYDSYDFSQGTDLVAVLFKVTDESFDPSSITTTIKLFYDLEHSEEGNIPFDYQNIVNDEVISYGHTDIDDPENDSSSTESTTESGESESTTSSDETTESTESVSTTDASESTDPTESESTTSASESTDPTESESTTSSDETTEPTESESTTSASESTDPTESESTTSSDETTEPTESESTTSATETTSPTSATVKLTVTKANLNAGKTAKLTVKNLPSDSKVTYSSTKSKVAKVNTKGKITALKKGNTKIKAKITFKDGSTTTLTKKIKVKTNPKLKPSSITVKVGAKATVKIKGKAANVKNKYTSTKYAKVTSKKNAKKIKIQGLKKGKTTLKIKVNGKKLKLKVTVK